jgi:APA family basic amino acid/polyamine antiporter
VLTGHAAAQFAGPAVVISFVIAGVVAGLAALCYSEMASMIPVAGSAYTYAYATLGEFTAWVIGWDLILEYLVGAATIAVGWSGYMSSLFNSFGVDVNQRVTNPPFGFNTRTQSFFLTGAVLNLPAFLIVIAITLLLIRGVQESTRMNNVAVVIKLLVIFLFIFATIPSINPENWRPFVPPNEGTFGHFGLSGIVQGSSLVFFA